MNEKRRKLLKLRSRIIDNIYKKRWEEVWFFPEFKKVKGVKGFLGTARIIFVAINPNFGAYPSKEDLFYYKNLKRQGFANAHLTDLFKIKRKNESAQGLLKDKTLLQEAKKYLAQELKIVRPKLVVGVGKSYKKVYGAVFNELKIPKYEIIPHYAPQFNNQTKKKNFRKALRKVRVIYFNKRKS